MDNVEVMLRSLGGPDLIAWHHRNGTSHNAADYLAQYRELLLRGLSATRLIYLDTNFWVRLRDAALDRGSVEAVKLLNVLRAMVRSREALCVSQLYSLLEVGKQEASSLQASVDLLDELTEGVAIASTDNLLQWECAEFIKATLDRDVTRGLCPWTKVGQIHKNELPVELPGPTTTVGKEVVLKALIDSLWNASFRHVLDQFNWNTKNQLSFNLDPAVLARVALRKEEQSEKNLTRDQVRFTEFSQHVQHQGIPVFVALLRQWHIEHRFPEGMAALQTDVNTVHKAAVQRFADRSLGLLLPNLAIMTELYSIYETDRQNLNFLSTNDWFDSCHAAAALPYCDVFLTERGLSHRLKRILKADVQYNCQVIGSLKDAVALL